MFRNMGLAEYGMIFVMGAILLIPLYFIYRAICYKTSYAEVVEYKGEVIDMDYVPPRTYTEYSHATKTNTTRTDPEKNIVIIRTSLKTTRLDSDKLYQRVRIGESVTVKSQASYVKPRYWEGKWEYDGDILISVTSALNQTVLFSDAEPVTYNGGRND